MGLWLKKLPVREPTTFTIVDGEHFPISKEYADLGVSEGWLILFRIAKNQFQETEYQYKHKP